MANPLLPLRDVLFQTGASEPVTYTAPGGVSVPARAVRSGDTAGSLSALGNPLRGVSFEIPRSSLPDRPKQGGIITADGAEAWRITQVTELGHVDSWYLVVAAV